MIKEYGESVGTVAALRARVAQLEAALREIVRHTRRMIDGEPGAQVDRACAIDKVAATLLTQSETFDE